MNRRRLTGLFVLASALLMVTPAFATIGNGVLQVFTDPAYTASAPMSNGQYLVIVGGTYYIRISGMSASEVGGATTLTVKIGYKDTNGDSQTAFFFNVPIQGSGPYFIKVTWTVPANAKVCTTATVHYKIVNEEYVASGSLTSAPGHMHVVPESYLGALGALGTAITAFIVFAAKKDHLMPSRI
jgi:hypothetical protein